MKVKSLRFFILVLVITNLFFACKKDVIKEGDEADFTYTVDSSKFNSKLGRSVTFYATNTNYDLYDWEFGDGIIIPTASKEKQCDFAPGVYLVTLKVRTKEKGKKTYYSKTTKTIIIDKRPEPEVFFIKCSYFDFRDDEIGNLSESSNRIDVGCTLPQIMNLNTIGVGVRESGAFRDFRRIFLFRKDCLNNSNSIDRNSIYPMGNNHYAEDNNAEGIVMQWWKASNGMLKYSTVGGTKDQTLSEFVVTKKRLGYYRNGAETGVIEGTFKCTLYSISGFYLPDSVITVTDGTFLLPVNYN